MKIYDIWRLRKRTFLNVLIYPQGNSSVAYKIICFNLTLKYSLIRSKICLHMRISEGEHKYVLKTTKNFNLMNSWKYFLRTKPTICLRLWHGIHNIKTVKVSNHTKIIIKYLGDKYLFNWKYENSLHIPSVRSVPNVAEYP